MLNSRETINLRRWCFSSDGSFLCTCYNSGILVYSFWQNQDRDAYSIYTFKYFTLLIKALCHCHRKIIGSNPIQAQIFVRFEQLNSQIKWKVVIKWHYLKFSRWIFFSVSSHTFHLSFKFYFRVLMKITTYLINWRNQAKLSTLQV